MRTIIIVSAKTGGRSTINSAALNWSELQADLTAAGIEFAGMTVLEKVNYSSLEHGEARIPEGEFTLYLMPKKIKGGSLISLETLDAMVSSLESIVEDARGLISDGDGGTDENDEPLPFDEEEVLTDAGFDFKARVQIINAQLEELLINPTNDPEVAEALAIQKMING